MHMATFLAKKLYFQGMIKIFIQMGMLASRLGTIKQLCFSHKDQLSFYPWIEQLKIFSNSLYHCAW